MWDQTACRRNMCHATDWWSRQASVVQMQRAGLWYRSSRVQTRPKPSNFSGPKKILSTPSFGREVNPFVPCRTFAACKRTRKCMRGSRSFRSKLPAISRPSICSFHYQGFCWRILAVQVGNTKDHGLYNKPSAAVRPGALAAGTLPHNIPQIWPEMNILSH